MYRTRFVEQDSNPVMMNNHVPKEAETNDISSEGQTTESPKRLSVLSGSGFGISVVAKDSQVVYGVNACR